MREKVGQLRLAGFARARRDSFKNFSSSEILSHLYLGSHKIEIIFFLPKTVSQFFKYVIHELGLFGTLKLALALQFIVMNAYFSVACNTKVSVRATLK